jgi:hypothetical protein
VGIGDRRRSVREVPGRPTNPREVTIFKRDAKPGLRKAAVLLLSAAGLTTAAGLAVPAAASAAPALQAARPSAHQDHVNHLNHLNHRQTVRVDGTVPASRSAVRTAPAAGGVRDLARTMVPAGQWNGFEHIISHESGWKATATNASSGAYGLAQALPGSKMASAGPDWRTNPQTQIKWALSYMDSTYGSPNAAWSFWQTHHWY